MWMNGSSRGQVHAGERAPDREPLALETGRGGGDRGDGPFGRGHIRFRHSRQDQDVLDGDRWHGSTSLRSNSASITTFERFNYSERNVVPAPGPVPRSSSVVTVGCLQDSNQDQTPTSYATAGVDEQREQDVFARAMRPWLARTTARSSMVTSITGLSSGYFATILQLQSGPPLALTTDGVGTKILLAREANRWEPIGDRLRGQQRQRPDLRGRGAARAAGLRGHRPDRRGRARGDRARPVPGRRPGRDRDPRRGDRPDRRRCWPTRPAAAPCSTWSAPRSARCPRAASRSTARGVRPGDVIIGLPSSGLHSNGYSLARHVLFDRGRDDAGRPGPGDGAAPGRRAAPADPGLRPAAVEALWAAGRRAARAWCNISGGGLLNLGRLAADVSYELDALPPPPPVFGAHRGGGRGLGRDHVRDVQHGHRVLHRRPRGPAAGGDGRAEERRRGAGPGGLGHRPSRADRVDPGGRPARPGATRSIPSRPWMSVPTSSPTPASSSMT